MFDARAGGYIIKDCMKGEIPKTHPDYVAHAYDMDSASVGWTHRQYEYNPAITHTEGVQGIQNGLPHWTYQPDRRVAYESAKYPWLVAAHRYHNKVRLRPLVARWFADRPPCHTTPQPHVKKGALT